MKHTPLFVQHVRDASAVINLKGFARAMQYHGHVAEHRATRQSVSLCDVSHMGELEIKGPDALTLVQKLITNDAGKLAINQALYSVMCDDHGMVLDDLVCFRLAADHFVWVVNVTKTDADYQWVLRHAQGMDVQVSNVSTDTALLALQGPESREALQRITKADLATLKYYWLTQTVIRTAHAEVPCIISRTGYTGERGYEIMLARDLAPWVWDELLMAGRPLGIVPQGVAARESLRTEAGYLLNGNDMDGETNPIEAGLGWVVKLSKAFIGRDALARIEADGVSRKMVGLEIEGSRTIRNGYRIYRNGKEIGRVTSGPLSPSLTGRNAGWAMWRPVTRRSALRSRSTSAASDPRDEWSRHPFVHAESRRNLVSGPGRPTTCASANSTYGRVSKRDRRMSLQSASLISASAASATSCAWICPRWEIRLRAGPRWAGSTATAKHLTSSVRCQVRYSRSTKP